MATKARHFLKIFLAGMMALIGFSSCSKPYGTVTIFHAVPGPIKRENVGKGFCALMTIEKNRITANEKSFIQIFLWMNL